MKLIGFVSLFMFVSILSLNSQAQARPGITLSCKHISPIQNAYLKRHVNFKKETKNFEKRVIDQFLKRLDGSKVYLLSSDVKKMKKDLSGIFAKIKNRDCSSLERAHKTYLKRLDERIKFVKKSLGKSFKFNKKTQLVLNSDKRKYPKSRKEAQAFHKKYLQFQVANYLATDMKLKEAKGNVSRNYDRIARRAKDFDSEDLWTIYLESFAHSLDPHSSYLSREALEEFEIQMRLSLDGIGATLSFQDGFTVIEQLIPGGAAFRTNQLKAKDKIVAVGQGEKGPMDNVIEMDLSEVVRKIRGKKGSLVRLSIMRKTPKGTKRFTVKLARDKIKLEDQAASIEYIERKIKGKKQTVGLLHLPSFYSDSRRKGNSAAKDVKRIIKEAKAKKISGLILDLSTNGGGSLDDAVKIAGLFFKTGNVVKQSQRGNEREALILPDTDKAVDYTGPLVVLTSRLSASASEIVSGTLKDYKRAIVVGGKQTFGKGSVQSVEPLPPGLGALKTTVGMFFTPGGYSTQHRGVYADIVFPSAYLEEDIGEKSLDYSLPPKKIKSFLSPTAYVSSGKGMWKQVDKSMISRLKQKSLKRIAKSKDFKEVLEDLEKLKKKSHMINVGEILSDKKEFESKKDKDEDDKGIVSKAKKREKYLKRADIKESLNIMFDIVSESPSSRTVSKAN